jgi:hypothetical protein
VSQVHSGTREIEIIMGFSNKRIITLVFVMIVIFTILVGFLSEFGEGCRTLKEDQWLREFEFDGLLLQALQRVPVKPSTPDPIRP